MSSVINLACYEQDHWTNDQGGAEIRSAIDNEVVATVPLKLADTAAMLDCARNIGGKALRAMTFHERGAMIRAIADTLSARKEELYELSYLTGATRADSAFDIEGGIGALFVYASKAKRLPQGKILVDGEREILSKGDFLGQHFWTSRHGVAVHINAYNFPVWGLLEKLGPTMLAGMPAIIKPATQGAWLSHAAFRIIVDSGVVPPGVLQLLIGSTGDLLDQLEGQDVVAFTGSAATAAKLRTAPRVVREGVRFMAEQDSLNASVLGIDATGEAPETDLFVKELVREMTQKAGQKCTAIRRALAPEALIEQVQAAVQARLTKMVVGNPRDPSVRVGALAGLSQRDDVASKLALLSTQARVVAGGGNADPIGADAVKGAFFQPTLLRCDDPDASLLVHTVEAFGPVSTLMPYRDTEHAIALARAGKGSLTMSLFTADPNIARDVVAGAGSSHGRLMVVGRDNAEFSTGHGAAMPQLLHGGPGRAGGGEELGGTIGMKAYMQRSAVQGNAALLDQLAGQ